MKFDLYQGHKSGTKFSWLSRGLKCNDEEFELLYNRYINSEYCELCGIEYVKRHNRHMEHSHETGEFRNIVCNRCNQLKYDVKMSSKNTSGYKGICKQLDPKSKNGFYWKFQAYCGGKQRKIKQSYDLQTVVKFAEEWKKANNYHT